VHIAVIMFCSIQQKARIMPWEQKGTSLVTGGQNHSFSWFTLMKKTEQYAWP